MFMDRKYVWDVLLAFWHHWYGKTVAFVSVGSIGAVVKWLAEFRKSWSEGDLAKERLRKMRKAEKEKQQCEDDEKLIPQVMERMDTLIAEERKAKNLWAGFIIPKAEWFSERMPEHEDRLIRKAYKEWKNERTKSHPSSDKWHSNW